MFPVKSDGIDGLKIHFTRLLLREHGIVLKPVEPTGLEVQHECQGWV